LGFIGRGGVDKVLTFGWAVAVLLWDFLEYSSCSYVWVRSVKNFRGEWVVLGTFVSFFEGFELHFLFFSDFFAFFFRNFKLGGHPEN
jgi:hypothetical protein